MLLQYTYTVIRKLYPAMLLPKVICPTTRWLFIEWEKQLTPLRDCICNYFNELVSGHASFDYTRLKIQKHRLYNFCP